MKEGRVTSAVVVDSTTAGKGGVVEPAGGWPTVDSVFARVAGARISSDSVDISYDPRFHFPNRAFVDRWRNAVDDEWTIEIRNFRVLPSTG